MRWPERSWHALLLLSGNLVFPGATLLIAALIETPKGEAIDWKAESTWARISDALLYANFFYAVSLVVVMRGWRLAAIVIGIPVLIFSAIVNFFAYFTITGVYW